MLRAPLIVRQMLNRYVDFSASDRLNRGIRAFRPKAKRFRIVEAHFRYCRVEFPDGSLKRININDKAAAEYMSRKTKAHNLLPSYLLDSANRLIDKFNKLKLDEVAIKNTLEYQQFMQSYTRFYNDHHSE